MKHLVFISVLLFLFAACTRQELVATMPDAPLHSELTAIDTLMQTEPDSALFALLPLAENDSLTPFDRHYADLLVSEALFKNDYEQTTRSALLDALSYFDSIADAYPQNNDYFFLSARSHYMNGVGLMETDSVVEACAEYLQTLQIMESHFDEKELVGYKAKFMALTYNRLGDLFSDQLMTEQALSCFKESLIFCKICPTSKYGLANTMVSIGKHFNMLNQPDSALFYFDMAGKSLPDTFNIVYRDILTLRAMLSFDSKKDTEGALKILYRVMEIAETENEKASRELVISDILYRGGKIDSAQICLEKVFDSDIDMLSKIQTARYLNEIHTNKGETEKAEFYNSFLAPLAVESYEQKNKDSQMVSMFEHHHKQILQKENKKESVSHVRRTVKTILFLALVVIPIIIYISSKRHLRKINEAKSEFEKEKQQNIALVNEMQMSNTFLKEENERLTEGLKSLQTAHKPTIKDYERLMKEPVVRNLTGRLSNIDILTTNPSSLYEKYSLTPKERRMLAEAFDKYCPNFSNRIGKLYPDLNKPETIVCQYLLLGLTAPQTAILIQKDKSTVYRNERCIKAKMKCKDICQHLKNMLFDVPKDK